MPEFIAAIGRFLAKTFQTSETKLTLVALLWAAASALSGGAVPMTLPQMDLSAIGLGVITPSPATLGVYVVTRCIIKAVTDGEVPFWPKPKEIPV